MEIHVIPMWEDNYGYLLVEAGRADVIDPTDANPILALLAEAGCVLERIWVTHAHHDHVAGLVELREQTGARVLGAPDPRLPTVDQVLAEGDRVELRSCSMEVLATPGHDVHDLSFLLRGEEVGDDALFCGDTLFVAGCGRPRAGGMKDLWESLQRLAALPAETRLYCGHEYTEENLRFASSMSPGDEAYAARLRAVQELRSQGFPTVPSTIGEERRSNPFLRASSLAEFSTLRETKNTFG